MIDRRSSSVLALVSLAAFAAAAQEAPFHARPAAIADSTALVPGQIARVGITFEIDPEWHLYWNGLSDTGMPIQIHPSPLPDGFAWQDQIWPAPHRHAPADDILDHIYEHRVTVILPVQVPQTAAPGSKVTFGFDLDWLVCKEACILEKSRVELTLPVALEAKPSPQQALFAQTLATAPVRPPAGQEAASPVQVRWDSPNAPVVGYPGAKALEFYPSTQCSRPTNLSVDGRVEGASIRIRIEGPKDAAPAMLDGMLKVELPASGGAGSGVSYFWVTSKAPAPKGESGGSGGSRADAPASK